MFEDDVSRSPSIDSFRLLNGISLSPESLSATQSPLRVPLPCFPLQIPSAQYRKYKGPLTYESKDLVRVGPPSSVTGAHQGFSQWEPRASPPSHLLGVTISDDDEENIKTILKEEAETRHCPPIAQAVEPEIVYNFSPNTVARRTSLFHDLPSSSGGEE